MELTEFKVTHVHIESEEEVEQYFKCFCVFLCMCASRERRVLKN